MANSKVSRDSIVRYWLYLHVAEDYVQLCRENVLNDAFHAEDQSSPGSTNAWANNKYMGKDLRYTMATADSVWLCDPY